MAKQLLQQQVQRRPIRFQVQSPFLPKYIQQRADTPIRNTGIVSSLFQAGGAAVQLTQTFARLGDIDRQRVANNRFLGIQGEMKTFFTDMQSTNDFSTWQETFDTKKEDLWETYGSDLSAREQRKLRDLYEPFMIQSYHALDNAAVSRTLTEYNDSWQTSMKVAVADGDAQTVTRLVDQAVDMGIFSQGQKQGVLDEKLTGVERTNARKELRLIGKTQALSLLQEVDANGNFVNWPRLNDSDRTELTNWHQRSLDVRQASINADKAAVEQKAQDQLWKWIGASEEAGRPVYPEDWLTRLKSMGMGTWDKSAPTKALRMMDELNESFKSEAERKVSEQQNTAYQSYRASMSSSSLEAEQYLSTSPADRGAPPMPYTKEEIIEAKDTNRISEEQARGLLAEYDSRWAAMTAEPTVDTKQYYDAIMVKYMNSVSAQQSIMHSREIDDYVSAGLLTSDEGLKLFNLFQDFESSLALTADDAAQTKFDAQSRDILADLRGRIQSGSSGLDMTTDVIVAFKNGHLSRGEFKELLNDSIQGAYLPPRKAADLKMRALKRDGVLTDEDIGVLNIEIDDYIQDSLWDGPGQMTTRPLTMGELGAGINSIIVKATDDKVEEKVADEIQFAINRGLSLSNNVGAAFVRRGREGSPRLQEEEVFLQNMNEGRYINLEEPISEQLTRVQANIEREFKGTYGDIESVEILPGGVPVITPVVGTERWVMDINEQNTEDFITFDEFQDRYPTRRGVAQTEYNEGTRIRSTNNGVTTHYLFYQGKVESLFSLAERGLVEIIDDKNFVVYHDGEGGKQYIQFHPPGAKEGSYETF